MKRIFTLLLLFAASVGLNAQQLFVEDFNFSGAVSGTNGWDTHSGSTTTPVMTTTGLTYTGYSGSGIGNAAALTGTGQDVNHDFAEQNAHGTTIFLSALVMSPETAATTGAYFMHLGDRTSATSFSNFAPRIYAKTDGAGVLNLGLAVTGNDAAGVYSPTAYATNTTYLIVVKYTIDTFSVTGFDEAKLWVRSSGVPADEASLGSPDVTISNQLGQNVIDAIGLRQTSGGASVDVVVDGIRISNTYSDLFVLPLHLTSFKASLVNNTASLSWTSANESSVKGFSIEKSLDGRNYSEIGFVNALNRSSNKYTAYDEDVKPGANYYRLKMIDIDGAARYSQVVMLSARGIVKASVFPNPAIASINVAHDRADKGAVIRILSMEGKQVKLMNVEPGAMQTAGIAVNDLVKGTYLLIFENNGQKVTTKFAKQ